MTNCPNCGAVITGPICEYCDTRFPWFDESKYVPAENYKAYQNKIDRLLAECKTIECSVLTANEYRRLCGYAPIAETLQKTARIERRL